MHDENSGGLRRRDLLASMASAPAIFAAAAPALHRGPTDASALGSSRRMARAAQALLAGVSDAQRAKMQYPNLGDPARTKWSNFPAGASPRAGIAFAELRDEQRVLVHDLLRASTSSQGYHKMTGALRADDVLHEQQPNAAMGGVTLFGAANYYVSVFGSPAAPSWAWMLTGHHMSAIFTVAHERVAFTPMFTGAQPLQIPTGLHAGWQVLPHDAGYAGELLATLSSAQQRSAVVAALAPGDVVAGPGRQNALTAFEGIAAARLSDAQQGLLRLLVEQFVGDAAPDAAQAQLALVDAGWSRTYFSWRGPAPSKTTRYYFRVHGPRIVIEYDVQEPLVSGGGHVHAITRDPLNDYGIDWLRLHYTEGNPIPGRPVGPGATPPGQQSTHENDTL